jgi:hypothetical protein
MKQHPDDTAALDAIEWLNGHQCTSCRRARPTAVHIGMCRGCLEHALYLDRGCGMPQRILRVGARR